jgi:peptide/nickel transport system substrate-binding protein
MDSSLSRLGEAQPGGTRDHPTRRHVLALAALGLTAGVPGSAVPAVPEGQLTWGVHISLAPTWFDPAGDGCHHPFMVMYALHDAVVKPMPDHPLSPGLAESGRYQRTPLPTSSSFEGRQVPQRGSGDGRGREILLRALSRYRPQHDEGAGGGRVETPDPQHVRFKLKKPWPDFLIFYASATGAGWIVPKKYLEKVGDEGFKKAPIGAGPYKFVSFKPGVEIVLEAFDQYWRKHRR